MLKPKVRISRLTQTLDALAEWLNTIYVAVDDKDGNTMKVPLTDFVKRSDFTTQNTEVSNALSQINESISTINSAISSIEKELDEKADVSALNTQVTALGNSITTLTQQLSQLNTDIQNKANTSDVNTAIAGVSGYITELGVKVTKNSKDISYLDEKVRKLVFNAHYEYAGTSTFKEVLDAELSGADVINLYTVIDSSIAILYLSETIFDETGNDIIAFEFSEVFGKKIHTYRLNKDDSWIITVEDCGGEGGTTYSAGDAIDLTNDTISVKYGKGLEIDTNKNLQLKLGKGLKFNTESGVEGEVSIDDVGQEVIEEVLDLSSELDKKITTTFNYAQITSAEDFAPYGASGTTRMIGQLFAVTISSEIRENDTVICVRAKQRYDGKVSFGIFEFDFYGNNGTGSTTWLCDTGVVSIKEGENQFPLKHIIPTSTVRPTIKMEPGKLYYATVMIANDAPSSGLFLASCPHYDQNYNATPKYTMVVSNMDNHVDWSIGTQRNIWFEGYNEFNNVPRLFMMIRNGEVATVPTIEPFANYSSFTLEHRYRIDDLFSLTFDINNHPLLYQKIRPAQDCIITKIGWVDYHSGATYDYATDIPLILNSNYTSMTRLDYSVEGSSGTKIDNVHYYHEFTLSTPISLQANNNYFVPCNMKISGADSEWVITYSSPSGTSKDLILFDSQYNVNSLAGDHYQYLSSQPGTLCRIVTDDGKTYTF